MKNGEKCQVANNFLNKTIFLSPTGTLQEKPPVLQKAPQTRTDFIKKADSCIALIFPVAVQ
jgi:hypothetical protein